MSSILNPATGQAVAEIKTHTVEDLAQAVRAAKSAQNSWDDQGFARRRRIIRSMGRIISEEADRLAELISNLTGKTPVDAMSTEVVPSALSAAYYAQTAAKTLRPERIHGSSVLFFNKKSRLFREAIGVIGIISPWNYPWAIPFQEVVMALMAGNAVILKVASQCQPLGDLMAEFLYRAGVPRDVFRVLHISGREAGPAFIHSGIGKLFFTGSVAVGKALAEEAGRILLPLSLELGGNDAMIVCEDANIERAVNGAMWAGLSNCGQSCGGVERIYVHESKYDQFRALLSRRVQALRYARDAGEDKFAYEQGSLTTASQQESVREHVADALDKGARIVASSVAGTEGGGGLKGFSHLVTVLEKVSNDMDVQRHESFGPLLTLTPFRDDEQAVALANDSYLGLTASVWTSSRKRADTLAAALEAGAITINDHLMSHGLPETPWGGHKESAIGRSHSKLGFYEMTEPKVVVHDSLGFSPRQMWWYPHNRSVYEGLRAVTRVVFGPGRIKALFKLIPTFLRMFRPARELDERSAPTPVVQEDRK